MDNGLASHHNRSEDVMRGGHPTGGRRRGAIPVEPRIRAVFEDAELGHKVDKATFAKRALVLREALLAAQVELSQQKEFAVAILINGVEAGGKGESVATLTQWLDARFVEVNAYDAPTDEEREHAPMWRYWRILPPRGRIAIFFGNWYTQPIVDRVMGKGKGRDAALERSLEEIIRFERMLGSEKVLLHKAWFHLSKKTQKKRLKRLEDDPETNWRVSRDDWRRFRRYDDFRSISERAIRRTSTGLAPWIVIDGSQDHFRSLMLGETLLAAMRARLDQPASKAPLKPVHRVAPLDSKTVLSGLDLTQTIPDAKYEKQLTHYQGQLARLTRHPRFQGRSLVIAFEGNDAAGKGGTIRRVTTAVDLRILRVQSVAAPSDEERARPYLWRFWRQLPRHGRMTVFDRTWYGRVLVERVEGFAAEEDWRRAYGEINDFEMELNRHGAIIVKFWLAISKQEQLKRFKAREEVTFKQFKITEEDWRNRKKWEAYADAVCEMVERTSTAIAPWVLVEANDKRFARVKVMRTLVERLEAELGHA